MSVHELCGKLIDIIVFLFPPLPTVEYAQIDWHDFILVETINFKESEMGTSITSKSHRPPLTIVSGNGRLSPCEK